MGFLRAAFRFQTGSIKRSILLAFATGAAAFRFQTGSIKSKRGGGRKKKVGRFRFQTGSIKSESVPVVINTFCCVSIPNWFD